MTAGIIAHAAVAHTTTAMRLFRLFIVGILQSLGVSDRVFAHQ
jgi:hypothetical protein